MTTRDDVVVEFNSSPRVAEVQAPSTEIIMQDLVDTLRKQEDTFEGMSFKKLLNASGKEDLGGGVKVGITVALQNLLLAFSGRTTPAQVGTVTSVLAAPKTGTQRFEDTSATFITNNVQRGSLVVNFPDQSIADVVSVDSETQLTTKTLVAGIGDVYTVADAYKVWNIIQVKATGGNLVSVDDAQSVINAILPTAFTQVILTSSSSATLAEQADIRYASYNGGVTIDLVEGVSGTEFPTGTPRQPSNNVADTVAIANTVGLNRIYPRGTVPLGAAAVFTNFTVLGDNPSVTILSVDAAANVVNTRFRDMTITGALDDRNVLEKCFVVGTLQYFDGIIYECLLDAGSTIELDTALNAHLINCSTGVNAPCTIDFLTGNCTLSVKELHGEITLVNKTGNANCDIDMASGVVTIAASCTDGHFEIRGVGKLVNNSTGTVTVDDSGLIDPSDFKMLRKLMMNRMETNPTTGIMTIFDDDDVTVLLSGSIYEDVLATQIYRGRGMERRERLT